MAFKIGIIGTGFVGTACSSGFEYLLKEEVEIREFDKYKNTENLESVVNKSEFLFICLPTPMNEDGSCNISIIEEVLKEINKISEKPKTIIIKSTIPPKSTQKLQN